MHRLRQTIAAAVAAVALTAFGASPAHADGGLLGAVDAVVEPVTGALPEVAPIGGNTPTEAAPSEATPAEPDDGATLTGVVASVVEPVAELAAPIADTTAALVEPAAEVASTVVASTVTEPVAEAAAPVLDNPVVTAVVEPVGNVVGTVGEVTSPVVDTVAPLLDPVLRTAAPVVDPLLSPVVEAASPVLDTVAPVLDPVVDPAIEAAAPLLPPATAPAFTGSTEAAPRDVRDLTPEQPSAAAPASDAPSAVDDPYTAPAPRTSVPEPVPAAPPAQTRVSEPPGAPRLPEAPRVASPSTTLPSLVDRASGPIDADATSPARVTHLLTPILEAFASALAGSGTLLGGSGSSGMPAMLLPTLLLALALARWQCVSLESARFASRSDAPLTPPG